MEACNKREKLDSTITYLQFTNYLSEVRANFLIIFVWHALLFMLIFHLLKIQFLFCQMFTFIFILFVELVPKAFLSLVLLLISNLTNGLRLHHFLGTKTTETNKCLKTDANGVH